MDNLAVDIARAKRFLLCLGFVTGLSFAFHPSFALENSTSAGPEISDTHSVTVITRRDIELTGAGTLAEFFRSNRSADFGLRRPLVVGRDRAAILVNGRPIPASSQDLYAIPLSAIERIEIVKSNSSVSHGGYAVGGAINIVLGRNRNGGEAWSSVAAPELSGGGTRHLGSLWNGSLGRGRIAIGVDDYQREEVAFADRSFTESRYAGGSWEEARAVSIRGNTATLRVDRAAAGTGGDSPGSIGIAAPLGSCDESVYTGPLRSETPPGAICGFPYANYAWQIDRRKYSSLFVDAEVPVARQADLYFTGRASRGQNLLQYAPEGNQIPDLDVKLLNRDRLIQTVNDLDISGVAVQSRDNFPDTVTLFHRFVGHGLRTWDTTTRDYDFVFGVRGQEPASDIEYDAYVRWRDYSNSVFGKTFVGESAIRRAIREGRYNLENPRSTDRTHLDAVRESSVHETHKLSDSLRGAGVTIEGIEETLADVPLRWRLGTELVSQDWSSVYDYRDLEGNPVPDPLGGALVSSSGDRRHWSTHGKLTVSVNNSWDWSLGGRYDRYDDVGSGTSHRVASRYRIAPGLALHASWGRGARPPSFTQLYDRTLIWPFVCDAHPAPANCARNQVKFLRSGNPALRPDRALSTDIGFDAALGPFRLSADWYRIDVSKTPASLSPQLIIELERAGQLQQFPGVTVSRDSSGQVDSIESPRLNIGETEAEGVNLGVGAERSFGSVSVALAANWDHVTSYEERVAGRVQPDHHPRERISVGVRAKWRNITAQWRTRNISGYWNDSRSRRFNGWTGHDIILSWNDALGVDGLTLTGGVLNLTDEGPTNDLSDPDAPTYPDSIVGRAVFLGARIRFGQ